MLAIVPVGRGRPRASRTYNGIARKGRFQGQLLGRNGELVPGWGHDPNELDRESEAGDALLRCLGADQRGGLPPARGYLHPEEPKRTVEDVPKADSQRLERVAAKEDEPQGNDPIQKDSTPAAETVPETGLAPHAESGKPTLVLETC